MSTARTISLDELNAAASDRFVTALAAIYEHSPWVAEAVASKRPFKSLAALHDSMAEAVKAAGERQQLDLINAHPDLAGKAARAGDLTADSKAEQQGAGLDRLNEDEFKAFHRLNDSYRKAFGFPFIICVGRHTKDSVFRQFELRLKHDQAAERAAALKEIVRIAALRLDRHVTAPDRLKVNGHLSTHVLDTANGRPAQGVRFELWEMSKNGGGRLIFKGQTNADGRTDRALIAERPVPIGSYELRFTLGDYFAQCGAASADPPFLDVVPVRFSVAEPEGHYHVPLLATPWSYATYRGS